MIREVALRDAGAIADIYNQYIARSVATFETESVSQAEMGERIKRIAGSFPFLVYEADGIVAGFCYAHPWKERAAYRLTLETTVYVAPGYTGRGVGSKLMSELIGACRERGYHALVACITDGNESCGAMHEKLGFRQVSAFREVGCKFGRWLGVKDYELLLEE